MTDHRILCTTSRNPTAHKHITDVGIGNDPDQPLRHLGVDEVRDSMDQGDRYYTFFRGETALVEPFDCSCGYPTIHSVNGALAHGLIRAPACTHTDSTRSVGAAGGAGMSSQQR
jgi:hypothetical protein